MKTLRTLLGAFLLLGSCFGQTFLTRHADIVLDQNGQPIGGATIRVCVNTATGTPCNSLASIFKDRAGTLPLGDSSGNFLADAHGNYVFYAASTVYQIQTTGVGVTTTAKDVLLPCDPANGSACVGSAGGTIQPVGIGLSGKPASGQILFNFKFVYAYVIPAGFTNSQVQVGTNPTATAVYTFLKNGVSFGTLSIATDGTPTFTSAAGASFAIGDRLTATAPSPQDATLSDVWMSISGTRN